MELVAHARKKDSEVAVEEISLQEKGISAWREIVQPFDWILHVSQEGDVEELRVLHTVCREEQKAFLPAICHQRVGLAGPLVHPDSKGCWESSWRRVHQTVFSKERQFPANSTIPGAMLANIIVFEMFKEITKTTESEQNNQFYLLDLDTMEGNWHSFSPHPLVEGRASTEWIRDLEFRIARNQGVDESNRLLLYFSQLASQESGIFHNWEEGDLKQLPLAQCRVQPVDLLSEGPAELLPEIVCSGLTHEEARREAGLTGIEAYITPMVDRLITTLPPDEVKDSVQEFVGVGAGETVVEGIYRGLQRCLDEELSKQRVNKRNIVTRLQLGTVEDERCQFYLEALTTMQGPPTIGIGEEVTGFPSVWVGTEEGWYSSVDLNTTRALRKALQQALIHAQNQETSLMPQTLEANVLLEEKAPLSFDIPACDELTQPNYCNLLYKSWNGNASGSWSLI